MEAAGSLACSKVMPLASSSMPASCFRVSFALFRRRLHYEIVLSSNEALCSGNCSRFLNPVVVSDRVFRRSLPDSSAAKCSYSISDAATSSDGDNSSLLKNFTAESVKSALLGLTPIDVCKWSLVLSVAVSVSKRTLKLLFDPFFWMYFSWTWLFWPWMVAIALALYGLYSFKKYLNGEASIVEQLAIVTSTFTWLTLVPPAYFNGFLEGWPFVFFLVYHYFFFLNVSVRKRLYGDYLPRDHDPKWDITLPNWQKLSFSVAVVAGHWLAAYEGKELHLIHGGWRNNLPIWILVMLAIFMQYHSTLYLAKYSEKVVVPTAVVEFGPYRFVRHPIYASTALLFAAYFFALRAPVSAALVSCACAVYYGRKAELEEAAMEESFGGRYGEYARKVRYRLVPFVY